MCWTLFSALFAYLVIQFPTGTVLPCLGFRGEEMAHLIFHNQQAARLGVNPGSFNPNIHFNLKIYMYMAGHGGTPL